MKGFILTAIVFGFSQFGFAQQVDVHGIETGANDETTVIQVQKTKGTKAEALQKPKFEITEGQEDVIGDGAVLTKPAKENWKKACKDWKAELKENNKGNQVLSSNCGSIVCASEGNETVCRSKATYKLKVKMDE